MTEPLPFDVVAAQKAFTWDGAFDLSWNGQWLAYAYGVSDDFTRRTSRAQRGYTQTGVPLKAGSLADFSRRQLAIIDLSREETVELGTPSNSSWAPAWSPAADRLAYFCDEGGTAGLWIWQRGKSERIGNFIARPTSITDAAKWAADGKRILCRFLPSGVSLAQADAEADNSSSPASRSDEGADDVPAITVFRSGENAAGSLRESHSRRDSSGLPVDLAIVDVGTHEITYVSKCTDTHWYAFSPDQRYVAYAHVVDTGSNDTRPHYDIVVYETASGIRRTLAKTIALTFAQTSWSWSPDSTQLGGYCLSTKSGADRSGIEVAIVSVAAGTVRRFSPREMTIDRYNWPLLWDPGGASLYLIGFAPGQWRQLWRMDLESGRAVPVCAIPGKNVSLVVRRPNHFTPWSADGGRSIWVLAREHVLTTLFRLDLTTGNCAGALTVNTGYNDRVCASSAGQIAYLSMDTRRPPDVWLFDVASSASKRITRLNEQFDRYALGEARRTHWTALTGETVHGALLLPPGYRPGRQLPLVLWVFGWEGDSHFMDCFGFSSGGQAPIHNLHVLATRGYAVLFPDIRLRTGTQMSDVVSAVMPGVDSLVEQGIVDPERLAVSGFSLGSYCALALIVQSRRFKAAMINGANIHSDLVVDFLASASANESLEYRLRGRRLALGVTPWQNPGAYINNSPMFCLDQTETPLLIAQGSNDVLFPAQVLFAALRDLRKKVELRIYPGEGHEIAQPRNVRDFWRRRIDFLDEHLDITRDARGHMIFDCALARSRGAG